jgi:hypothetical protein
MKHAVDMVSDGVIYLPIFMKTCSGIRVVLRLLPQMFERRNVGITNGRGL